MPGLTAEHFETLLARFDADRDRAGEKYEVIRQTLVKFFEWNGCFPAEALADEAIDRLAWKCHEQQILDVNSFVFGIARNVRREAIKRASRNSASIPIEEVESMSNGGGSAEDDIISDLETERNRLCVRKCLQRLSNSERELFVQFFSAQARRADYRQKLAARVGVKIGTLRTRVCRLRSKLELCLTECMKHSAV